MTHRVKVKKNAKVSTVNQTLEAWRALKGLLKNKGPKSVVGWQKRGRKENICLNKAYI